MVSTAPSSQYITDYTMPAGGKSPLALLAKTCETIGLPDSSSKKSCATPDKEKKTSPKSSSKSSESRSPTQTPSSSRAGPASASVTTAPGLPPPFLPAFPQMPFPLMGYPLGCFSMPGAMPSFAGLKPPCPNLLMQRQCTTAGCPSCTPPDMLSAFAANPLFAAYPFMPTTSSAGMPPFPMLPAFHGMVSMPSTSSASTSTASASTSASASAKIPCAWQDCGQLCSSADDLTAHFKCVHAARAAGSPSVTPSPISSTASSGGGKASKTSPVTSSSSSMPRFHPYSKAALGMHPAMLPPFSPLSFPALQAMYQQQRLMSSMALP